MSELAPLGERPIRALAWLIQADEPQHWHDIVEEAGGWRPSYYGVIKPLWRRELIRKAEGPKIGDYFEPTAAGRAFIAQLERCPMCKRVLR